MEAQIYLNMETHWKAHPFCSSSEKKKPTFSDFPFSWSVLSHSISSLSYSKVWIFLASVKQFFLPGKWLESAKEEEGIVQSLSCHGTTRFSLMMGLVSISTVIFIRSLILFAPCEAHERHLLYPMRSHRDCFGC